MIEPLLEELDRSNPPWLVESLRLTSFLSPSASVEQDWWQRVTGEVSETKVVKGRIGGYQEHGPFVDRRLVLIADPRRVDWHLVRATSDVAADFPNIGSLKEAIGVLTDLMRRWCSIAPPVQRLAFGALLIMPVENRQSGIELVSRRFLSRLNLEPRGVEEFLYLINRPRGTRTDIPNLRINRLSKWAVAVYQRMRVAVPAAPSQMESPVTFGDVTYGGNLELDMSTSESFSGELPRDHVIPLLEELIAFGLEIALKGDIP